MKTNKFVLFLVILLAISVMPSQGKEVLHPGVFVQEFAVDESTQTQYEVNWVEYNSTSFMPIYKEYEEGGGSYMIGDLTTGDLVKMRAHYLPSLTAGEREAEVGFSSTGTTENWSGRYNSTLTYVGWPTVEDAGSMPFFKPFIPVFSDASNWTEMQTAWDAVSNITATYDGSEFRMSGSNSTLNIDIFVVAWDVATGIMTEYISQGLESTESGDVPFRLELVFMYTVDESQWGLNWGIAHDTIGFRWTNVLFNDSDTLDLGEDEFNFWVESGDIMVIEIMSLSNLEGNDGPPHMNVTLASENYEADTTINLDELKRPNDGPILFAPVIPVGNDNFFGNITDQFNAIGTAIIADDVLTFTYNDGSNHYEQSKWNTTTGILMGFYYEATGEGGEQFLIDLDFIYHFAPSGEPIFGVAELDQRYIINDVQNGTEDRLDLGDSGEPFSLYDGDVVNVHQYTETIAGEEQIYISMKTSSGESISFDFDFPRFGLETTNGPPFFIFTIPIATEGKPSEAWFVNIGRIHTALGYTVVNNDTFYSVTEFVGGLTATAVWDKSDGVLAYYNVQGTPEGTFLKWEMTRGTSPTAAEIAALSWGVATGDSFDFTLDLTAGEIQFQDDGGASTTYSAPGTHPFGVEIVSLSDLTTDGPSLGIKMTLGGAVSSEDIGMQNPGFEFASFEGEGGGGPPLMYFAIPVGTESTWSMFEAMYTEAGYSVTNGADTFSVGVSHDGTTVAVTWSKTDGVMQSYSFSGDIDGTSTTFTLTLDGSTSGTTDSSSTSVTSSTSDDAGGIDLPVDPVYSFVALPFVAFAMMVVRRRKLA